MPRSLDELDRWAVDHELRHMREAEERRIDGERVLDAVKKHVDGAVKPIADMNVKIDSLVRTNDKQLEMMAETQRYRGQREEQERAAAQRKSDEASALERSKVAAQRWQIIAGVISAIAVAIIGALVASHR